MLKNYLNLKKCRQLFCWRFQYRWIVSSGIFAPEILGWDQFGLNTYGLLAVGNCARNVSKEINKNNIELSQFGVVLLGVRYL